MYLDLCICIYSYFCVIRFSHLKFVALNSAGSVSKHTTTFTIYLLHLICHNIVFKFLFGCKIPRQMVLLCIDSETYICLKSKALHIYDKNQNIVEIYSYNLKKNKAIQIPTCKYIYFNRWKSRLECANIINYGIAHESKKKIVNMMQVKEGKCWCKL